MRVIVRVNDNLIPTCNCTIVRLISLQDVTRTLHWCIVHRMTSNPIIQPNCTIEFYILALLHEIKYPEFESHSAFRISGLPNNTDLYIGSIAFCGSAGNLAVNLALMVIQDPWALSQNIIPMYGCKKDDVELHGIELYFSSNNVNLDWTALHLPSSWHCTLHGARYIYSLERATIIVPFGILVHAYIYTRNRSNVYQLIAYI